MIELGHKEQFRVFETDKKAEKRPLTKPRTLLDRLRAFTIPLRFGLPAFSHLPKEYFSMKHKRVIQVERHPQEGGDFAV